MDGGLKSTRGIPKVHRDVMSKYILDATTLDKNLFAVLEPAYDAPAELEHVRESLVNIYDSEDETKLLGLFGSFAEYALDEIKGYGTYVVSALSTFTTLGSPLRNIAFDEHPTTQQWGHPLASGSQVVEQNTRKQAR